MRRAVVLCATFNQLMNAQAVARCVRDRYEELSIVWHGDAPVAALEPYLVSRVVDCAGWRRVKPWMPGGARAAAAAREAFARAAGDVSDADLYAGDDNSMFFRLSLPSWDRAVLYEEGIGFYAGTTGTVAERLVKNLVLACKGLPRITMRDFTRNARLSRFACNHPWLLSRPAADVVDTSEAYRAVLREAAARLPPREPVERLYVSGNLSGSRYCSLSQELAILRRLRGEIARRFGDGEVHVKFHPFDSAEKRAGILALGYTELALDGPFELDALVRRYGNVVSFQSSVLSNLALFDLGATRLWILRGRDALSRRLARPPLGPLFERLVARTPALDFLDWS